MRDCFVCARVAYQVNKVRDEQSPWILSRVNKITKLRSCYRIIGFCYIIFNIKSYQAASGDGLLIA
jgi:hypothetical protein